MSQKVIHNFEPIYNRESQILILGTIPSKKSREVNFYYGNPQNRFWKILESLFQEEIKNKKEFLLNHNIALWDVLKSCEIIGSSDSSIKNEKPNNLNLILKKTNIKLIVTTGKTAHKFYQKYFKDQILIPEISLPSPSPANCAYSLEVLIKEYSKILPFLKKEETELKSN